MPYNDGSEMPYNDGPERFPSALKLLIAGGFGVGKTTFVGAVSEIEPLRTEELLTTASVGTDNLTGVERKSTTTVAMDFGRITIGSQHVLYLFGTPGQERFWFMWDELSNGAMGAIVLADTRRLEDCFAAVDFFESRGINFLIAVNEFDTAFRYEPDDVRGALDLKPNIPVMLCDARDRRSATGVLISLIKHLLDTRAADDQLAGDPSLDNGARHDL
jgi:signal recognition particle receptor subunit beta